MPNAASVHYLVKRLWHGVVLGTDLELHLQYPWWRTDEMLAGDKDWKRLATAGTNILLFDPLVRALSRMRLLGVANNIQRPLGMSKCLSRFGEAYWVVMRRMPC